MNAKLKLVMAAVLFGVSAGGCAPRETFSWIDRNCFVADWTNHHSCLSCCCKGNCQHAHHPGQYPMLELGAQPSAEADGK